MNAAYVLHHVRSDDEYGENAKLIGVYGSESSARTAVERLLGLPGFCDHKKGFQISAYRLDKDHWSERFDGD